jgi:hypothetical protein
MNRLEAKPRQSKLQQSKLLQSNPFCTRFVRPGAIKYRFSSDDPSPESICESLQSRRLGLITGDHGSGKTTLLHTLMPTLERRFRSVFFAQICDPQSPRPVERLLHGRRCWRSVIGLWKNLNPQDLLIVDGLEQLWSIDRIGLLIRRNSTAPTLLATSHQRVFGIPVLFQTDFDRPLVGELTESLIQNSSESIAAVVRNKLANHDWDQNRNVRDFWFDCYDTVQAVELQSTNTL